MSQTFLTNSVPRVITLVRNKTFVCCWSNFKASKRACGISYQLMTSLISPETSSTKVQKEPSPKSNIDTKNDGPWKNVSPASNMASFWVSMFDFRGQFFMLSWLGSHCDSQRCGALQRLHTVGILKSSENSGREAGLSIQQSP